MWSGFRYRMLARKKLGKNRSSGISNRFECVPWVVWSAKKHQTDCKSNFLNQPNTTQISLNSIKVNSTHIVASSNIIHVGFKFLVQGLHLLNDLKTTIFKRRISPYILLIYQFQKLRLSVSLVGFWNSTQPRVQHSNRLEMSEE